MRFQIDQDMHIHSYLSLCSTSGRQVPATILEYGVQNGLSTLVLTDHYWDERVPGASFGGAYTAGAAIWYAMQNTNRTDLALPLPQAEGVRFLYGCEAEMNKHFTIGLSREEAERRAFIIVPTTHLHMGGFTRERGDLSNEEHATLWVKRFEALLDSGLPFHKVGVAHLTCTLFAPQKTPLNTAECLSLIQNEDMYRLFDRTAKCGMGVELNFDPSKFEQAGVLDEILRPYRIAMECGCKFYLGSDAHIPAALEKAVPTFQRIVELLELDEDQKFKI